MQPHARQISIPIEIRREPLISQGEIQRGERGRLGRVQGRKVLEQVDQVGAEDGVAPVAPVAFHVEGLDAQAARGAVVPADGADEARVGGPVDAEAGVVGGGGEQARAGAQEAGELDHVAVQPQEVGEGGVAVLPEPGPVGGVDAVGHLPVGVADVPVEVGALAEVVHDPLEEVGHLGPLVAVVPQPVAGPH